jgi:hypothetical protein
MGKGKGTGLGTGVLVVLAAAVAAQALQLGSFAPLLLGGALVAANVGLLGWRARRPYRTASDPRWFVGPLAVAWLVVSLLPVHKLSHRGITESGPAVDLESLLHVAVFAAAAVLALVVIRTFEPTLERTRPPVLLFLLPTWTVSSGLWSATGAYAVVRGALLAAVAMLAWATMALGRSDRAALDAVVGTYVRWFVRLSVGLVALGVAFGPRYVSAGEANLERFTWMGAHPLAASVILSTAAVLVLVTPGPVLRLPAVLRAAAGAVLVVALVANHSRQTWAFLAVAVVLYLLLAGRGTPTLRLVGIPLLGAAGVATVLLRGPQVWEYLLRNEDSDQLSSGNGRLDLWAIGARALETPVDWLIGLGHGITRTVFVAEAPWARTAHSSFLNALVSLGLVGLGLLLAVLVLVARDVIAGRLWRQSPHGMALTLLLVVALLNGVVSDNLVIPNLNFALLNLVAAVAVVAREGSPPPATAPPAPAPRSLARARPAAGGRA